MKTCARCNTPKSIREFGLHKNRNDGLQAYCKPCKLESQKLYRKNGASPRRVKTERVRTPDERRHSNYKTNYGITLDDYNKLLEIQSGKCAICNQTARKHLVVDHCHATKNIRGLLCYSCNAGLGMLKDSTTILTAAIHYLETPCNIYHRRASASATGQTQPFAADATANPSPGSDGTKRQMLPK